ncbi:Glyoxalase-like domain protein [Thalassoglobus neptunius]|uniref:Glyoxalase-like domain protein n=1 Tax=Thalassoglobus neptunius TaxID=1938619 RepID=A0A5C5VAI4_9PLAN|nr:VOC family protein [Thalassoglobus neptunius]TWT34983.1 Glyoxalase-like domain protein [Thalassoglobus neptunius]
MSVKPVPDGYHAVQAYLIVQNATEAIEWYKEVFGTEEQMRLTGPGGSVGHAELQIGDSVVMLASEFPDMEVYAPEHFNGSPISMAIYLEDVDTVYQRAIDAGATAKRPVQDQFYGDRSGMIVDPFGHSWSLATHIEDVTPEEVQKRFDQMMSAGND